MNITESTMYTSRVKYLNTSIFKYRLKYYYNILNTVLKSIIFFFGIFLEVFLSKLYYLYLNIVKNRLYLFLQNEN